MDLIVKQKLRSFSICKTTEDKVLFTGYWKYKGLFHNRIRGEVFDASGVKRYSISQKKKFFKLRNSFLVSDRKGNIFSSSPQLPNKASYVFKDDKDQYTIKIHTGNKLSVFNKDKDQIAVISEGSFELFGKSKILITAEHDINIELLFLCILCMNFGDTASHKIDLGEAWNTEPIDRNWRPCHP